MAVTDANGAWVDAGKISQRELIGMVRGQPNTQVSLQVRPAGSSATRVVTLGRQQIIFRPQ
jgi:C-terminal processing protease CtpA/Prc